MHIEENHANLRKTEKVIFVETWFPPKRRESVRAG